MKIGAIIAIFIGVIIILSGVSTISISFWFVVQLIFAALFLNSGVKVFRYPSGEHFGSLIFSGILIIDAFGLWGVDWNFGELFLAMIGSYLVGWGLMSIFGSTRFMKKSPKSSRQSLSISRPVEAEEYEVDIDTNLTKVLLVDTQRDKGIDATLNFDKKSFSGTLHYNKEGNIAKIKAKCKAKAGVSSVLTKSRMNIELSSVPIVKFSAALDGVDAVLDFSNIKLDTATIKSNISRLSIVPSKLRDSRIDIDCEITSLNLRVPKDVGLTIVHQGELNWNNFDELIYREDGYISRNIETAKSVCQVFIKSEMSKLSIDWI
ncbi:hypothetical protein [Kosmotoga pacifica]|uniref:Uncharacterized protein n=1 Tax=Kosmotoga pacifica TaxID=1330330 RepID=A0A0G2ZBN5_9BACT|nr:hypothetical protein [Kosmotoga pacifica]AKI97486.1 hypothetical protein IX53_06255 [Kosmotoga pacifica]